MKLGVFLVLFQDQPFTQALDYVAKSGLQAVEIGCGAYPGSAHCRPAQLLRDAAERKRFVEEVRSRGLTISALSCHGNPLHPNAEIRERHRQEFRDTVRLAAEIGVDTVITFSGCPGDHEGARYPNWVTCPWPEDYLTVLQWQWEQVAIPYWQEEARFCAQHGVRVAIEAHPGFLVYNPETALRLRQAAGEQIGVNFDPSHLFWQQVDPAEAIRALGPAIFHVHAKDTELYPGVIAVHGVLDTKPYRDEIHRSWIFRSVGYGHGPETWKRIISALRLVGYDGAISIEHEDSLLSANEGFQKAVSFLKEVLVTEPRGRMWWA